MKLKTITISLISAGLVGAGAIGYSAHTASLGLQYPPVTTQAPEGLLGTTANSANALPDFTALAAKYGPAVVNVTVTSQAKPAGAVPEMPQLDPDDPFYQFFKRFQAPVPRGEVPIRGVGSGFIVSSDGVVLTNAHVVDSAKDVDVKLTDKREFKAKVVGVDKQSDIAVLKIDAKDLPTVKLGNPADLKVGEWVVAIGSPFGFENTVTQGIVSAKWRTLPDETYVPFIQTDVPVNPGNSGGPLFNLKGEVVGINAQIYSHSGGYEGLSFAIPIDIAANVEHQILQHGRVTRGHLGIAVQDVTQGLADSFGLKSPEGVLVSTVEPGSPAAEGGLKPGDVILRFDGKTIANSAELPAQVAATKPGTAVRLDVMRNGVTKELSVTVGELNNKTVAEAGPSAQSHGRLGLTVRPLTPEEGRQAGDGNGLLVEDATGPAAQAGIQPGDVIIAVNGTPVRTANQLRELAAKAGKHVALLVQRDEMKIFVPVDLG
ncbi:MAG TPA: DegQ family serine endoprotease [Burkholderiales bacterium]|nr:DegQ family serine endoprotease [Burkholderiales bacterium]